MSRSLTPPSAGQPIRASFFAELLREIRANRLLNGTGYRTKRGPNGTSLSIDVPRAAAGKSKDIGRFAISISDETATFANPYYDVGNVTYVATSPSVSVSDSGVQFLALELTRSSDGTTSAEVRAYSDFNSMQAAQTDFQKCVIPLYKLEDGVVVCDMRTGPRAETWEYSS